MFCPACTRRWDQLAAQSCPICAGKGLLSLGPLTRRYPPATISLAVAHALELCATIDMRARKDDYADWLTRARHNLTVTVNRCIKSGLLARNSSPELTAVPDIPEPNPADPATAAALAVAVTGYPDEPGVAHRLAAPPVPFSLAVFPVNGLHPGVSNGGSSAFLALIVDPIKPLDRETTSRREQIRVGELLGNSMFPEPDGDR